MGKNKLRLFGIGCVLFIISSAWLLFIFDKRENANTVAIYPDSGFYLGDMTVEITGLLEKESVYYTVDGREPAGNHNNVMEYTGPITLSAAPPGKAYSLSFFHLSGDGSYLKLAERNYIVLEEGRMLDTDYVICVQGDEGELFGYEEGIFVRGRRWDEYMAENPDVDIQKISVPANYYEDREVSVHAAVFTRTGEELISQNCGLKIYGSGTRYKNQKSFRLIARHLYDSVNEFSYPFFDSLLSDNTGCQIQNYQRLSLHNTGDDNGYGFIRNTLCSELAGQAGFPDVLASQSATVYINDRYMGVYWLQNAFDDRYFSEKYGAYQGEMAVCGESMNQLTVDDEQDPWERECAETYNDFCSWLKEADVNDPAVWQRVAETIDVDNLIQYVAIEYYVNNQDWPRNNVKVYRYQPAIEEEYCEGTVFDGRYRYLLFDMDYGMGLFQDGWFGKNSSDEILWYLCDPELDATIFAKLIERKECRDAFINEVVNLRNGSFLEKNVLRELDRLNCSRWNELTYMIEQTDILKNTISEAEKGNLEHVQAELQTIRYFAGDRGSKVLTEMMRTWNCGTLFQVETESQGDIQICINGQTATEESWYFAGIPITLSVNEDSRIRVKGYILNGTYVAGEKLELLAEQYLAGDEKLHIVPRYEPIETEQLSIQSFSVRGSQDYVILENTGTIEIHLEDYFLSDDADKVLKGRLPNVILKPEESIIVYGGKYDDQIENENFQVDFSWSKEEPVILAHLTKGIIECRNYH